MTLANHQIEKLIALCKKGNQLAQLEVYNRYHKAMYNIALRIVKDTAEAEDIMQESFIAAFQKLDSFKGTATFGSWLKRIVVNNSIVQYRKNQRFTEIPENGIKDEATEETMDTEDYTQIRVQQVLKGLQGIHTSYQTVLTLHFIEGYDYEELCEILNISYANCRTLISRAKDSLRKKLETL
ncbi:MAG TPA: RNA polymerase sigma factor [Flavobacteriaceae bacterium]|nr:RNA polymerase sigma factor [Flavobacteriaceae bacterium]MCB9213350.1 RNA polymerase sigma factor [Alteromonas sp.]HPF10242.1 RNA polymerase sigma factor [Flavobacteriaceae bacterium]HQU20688.1 RNA polymerase sigma factor [Flavobacteriaceae bacterium]HQU64894.1 RNA polymerase sigma factor [Flavobacteriaceae bacterium]